MVYGQCSYLRLIDNKQILDWFLIMAKSRVIPIKPITICRLEFTAALITVKVNLTFLEEFDFLNVMESFWTISKDYRKLFISY